MKEVEHNVGLVLALVLPEEYRPNAYGCLAHGCGMADECPRIYPVGGTPALSANYDGTMEPGMVLCVESYVGAIGEREGVKLEQQVLLVAGGYELLSTNPFEKNLLD